MKHLEVILSYGTADSRSAPGANLALPVRALDTDGSVLADGVASVLTPAVLDLPDATQIAFVRLTWPSGRTETQRAAFGPDSSQQRVTFADSRIYRNEWSAWAVPKLNPRSPLMMSRGEETLNLDLNRFRRTWLRLWKFVAGSWTREQLAPQMSYRSDAAWQIDLILDSAPWMLQIGGSNVTWRFVSLPGGGPARVLMTPKDSTDPRADALKVIVTSFRTDAETLLEFLSRDAMRAAETLADSAALARRLFSDKFTDPVSALAGAYYLLRRDDWSRVPLRWFENLSTSFPWLPDAAVIHCIRLLRAGMRTDDEREEARSLLARSLECGWPAYAEGISLLEEAAGLLSEPMTGKRELLDRVRDLGAAKSWAGAAASFYGRAPDKPSPLQWVGMPWAPRRRRHHRALQEGQPRVLRAPKGADFRALVAPQVELAHRISPYVSEQLVAQRPREDGEFLLGNITA
jgi:hypothetical protein